MSEFPIVTNKYCAKAEFSANICNDVYKFGYVGVDTDAKLIEVTAGSGSSTVVEFESPVVLTNEFGNGFSIVGTASDTVVIEGNDYLGQEMKLSVSVTTTAANQEYPFKYIRKITFTTGTITIKEINASAFPPFKTVNVLSAVKNGVKITAPTLTGPVLTANTNGIVLSRGKLALTSVSKGDELSFVCVADNSTVTISNEEVGGLYGNPSVIS